MLTPVERSLADCDGGGRQAGHVERDLLIRAAEFFSGDGFHRPEVDGVDGAVKDGVGACLSGHFVPAGEKDESGHVTLLLS